MRPFSSEMELAELLTRVLCDVEPPKEKLAEAVYLFGETPSNEESVLNTGAHLLTSGLTKSIALFGEEKQPGCRGFSTWSEQLAHRGCSPKDIVSVTPLSLPPTLSIAETINTYTEAAALISHAKEAGWKTLYITAAPFHQLRAFISVVTITLREYPQLSIYNKVGTHLQWTEHAVHSQMVLEGKRVEFINSELARIVRYHKKGDLASGKEILAYLNRRDND